ncbi:hypothetical protein ABW20_dc0106108 [Dactylellina cionopaga]|nr:hypothetical protein ABW20_dc0106108 [Dactylellina cionopaga]
MAEDPHTHRIHFLECKHKDYQYVFLPDPKNPLRCICARRDVFKIGINSHEQVKYAQEVRKIRAECDDCRGHHMEKLSLEEYLYFLQKFEEELEESKPAKRPRYN